MSTTNDLVLDLTIGTLGRSETAARASSLSGVGDFLNYQHKKFSKRRRSSASSADSCGSATLDTATHCCVGGGMHALQRSGAATASYMAPPLLLGRGRRYKYCAANGATGVAYYNEATHTYEFSMSNSSSANSTTSVDKFTWRSSDSTYDSHESLSTVGIKQEPALPHPHLQLADDDDDDEGADDDDYTTDDADQFTGRRNSVKHMLYLIRRTQRRISSL